MSTLILSTHRWKLNLSNSNTNGPKWFPNHRRHFPWTRFVSNGSHRSANVPITNQLTNLTWTKLNTTAESQTQHCSMKATGVLILEQQCKGERFTLPRILINVNRQSQRCRVNDLHSLVVLRLYLTCNLLKDSFPLLIHLSLAYGMISFTFFENCFWNVKIVMNRKTNSKLCVIVSAGGWSPSATFMYCETDVLFWTWKQLFVRQKSWK